MLLYLLITGLSFFLFLKPLYLKPLPSWASDRRLVLLPPGSWKELLLFPYLGFKRNSFSKGCHFLTRLRFPWRKMTMKRRIPFASSLSSMEAPKSEAPGMSILDLPDLALECILEKLPPAELCCMAGVNTSLRERCISDHFWERHMKQKWGKVIGPTAYREWQSRMALRKDTGRTKEGKQRGLSKLFAMLWPSFWVNKPKVDQHGNHRQNISLPDNSIMSWYLALETGRFWFPAQVYNRENGHVGFMLSCYDSELSYDPRADTFQARYPPHGRRAIAVEHNVPWERLRAPPIDSPPDDLHISDCLSDLKPGNHIEIQWRRNKEFPYGWWYGVVGHLESCDGNESYCLCHNSDTVILEFHQYTPGSRWRCTAVNRKDHREEGNEADGFYGGIRKLYANDEISMWKRLWPADVLE